MPSINGQILSYKCPCGYEVTVIDDTKRHQRFIRLHKKKCKETCEIIDKYEYSQSWRSKQGNKFDRTKPTDEVVQKAALWSKDLKTWRSIVTSKKMPAKKVTQISVAEAVPMGEDYGDNVVQAEVVQIVGEEVAANVEVPYDKELVRDMVRKDIERQWGCVLTDEEFESMCVELDKQVAELPWE